MGNFLVIDSNRECLYPSYRFYGQSLVNQISIPMHNEKTGTIQEKVEISHKKIDTGSSEGLFIWCNDEEKYALYPAVYLSAYANPEVVRQRHAIRRELMRLFPQSQSWNPPVIHINMILLDALSR